MRRIFYAVTGMLLALSLLSACKTTEENYQKAYEAAREKRLEGLTQEEIDGFRREEAMPKAVYKGDSIPLKGMYVKCVEGGADGKALRYNVIVASFRQQFNARSVMKRLADAGYSGAVLLSDADKRFYVGALTTDSLDLAVAELKRLRADGKSPVALKEPFPYILKRP